MKDFIETDRLILRKLELADDINQFKLESDPEVHKYLGNKPISTIEQARYYINYILQQYERNDIGRWAVL